MVRNDVGFKPRISPAIRELIERAGKDKPVSERAEAMAELSKLENLPDAVFEVARAAVRTKPTAGLVATMDNNDWDAAFRWSLIWRGIDVLSRLGERKPEAAAALLAAARKDVVTVCDALGRLGYAGDDVLAFLRSKLARGDSCTRGSAGWALVELGSDPAPIAAILAKGLDSNDDDERESAAYHLASLESHASCEYLVRAARDSKWMVRRSAIEAIMQNECACELIKSCVKEATRDRADLVQRIAIKAHRALSR